MLKALTALGAIVVASALLVPTASLASSLETTDAELVTATVSYADLDLREHSGVSTLRYRINGAARTVCGPSLRYEAMENFQNRQCVSGAVASAQPAFDRAIGAARGSVIIEGAALIVSAPRQ